MHKRLTVVVLVLVRVAVLEVVAMVAVVAMLAVVAVLAVLAVLAVVAMLAVAAVLALLAVLAVVLGLWQHDTTVGRSRLRASQTIRAVEKGGDPVERGDSMRALKISMSSLHMHLCGRTFWPMDTLP